MKTRFAELQEEGYITIAYLVPTDCRNHLDKHLENSLGRGIRCDIHKRHLARKYRYLNSRWDIG